MEHKIIYKTPNGTLQETLFDDFDQFADSIDQVAHQYYQGLKPEVEVETIYDNGMIKTERISNVTPNMESREGRGLQYLEETCLTDEGKAG